MRNISSTVLVRESGFPSILSHHVQVTVYCARVCLHDDELEPVTRHHDGASIYKDPEKALEIYQKWLCPDFFHRFAVGSGSCNSESPVAICDHGV